MNYGILTATQQAAFRTYQGDRIRKPTVSVLLSGVDDVKDYIQNITFSRAIETGRGILTVNVGNGVILAMNDDETFYSGGESQIPVGTQVKIWAGFSGLNVPVFAGVVTGVKPITDRNLVEIGICDNMWYFQNNRVQGFQENTTVRAIMEGWVSDFYLNSEITTHSDMDITLTAPAFDPMLMITALENLCRGIFSVPFFDADGSLQVYEREYCNDVDFTFNNQNVKNISNLVSQDIVNACVIEYKEFFQTKYKSQDSIDLYRERVRDYRLTHLNVEEVAYQYYGTQDEGLDNALEGLRFTSAATSAFIDTVHVMMMGDGVTGQYTLKLYSDSGGLPDTLMATSEIKYAADLYESFVWEHINFIPPVSISPSTDYWLILDTSGLTGTVYVACNYGAATGKHAYYSGGWVAEDNKQMVYKIRSSPQAIRASTDLVKFFQYPRDRIRVYAMGAPHLELMDAPFVDVTTPFEQSGRFKIIERWLRYSPSLGLETVDTLERV